MIRNMVEIRHAWYMEHKSALGSCSDFALLDALTPTRKNPQDTDKLSTSWDDYNVPPTLPDGLRNKLDDFRDLMNE